VEIDAFLTMINTFKERDAIKTDFLEGIHTDTEKDDMMTRIFREFSTPNLSVE
jgi:hypothetical protein